MTTYIRKYYLHRKVKDAGYSLTLGHPHKTINVFPGSVSEAKTNKYIGELQERYNYAVQIINPMIHEDNLAG